MMKPERYKGIEIYFYKERDRVIAGFRKRPYIVGADTKTDAFEKIKEVIDGLDPIVLRLYTKNPKAMKELEDLWLI